MSLMSTSRRPGLQRRGGRAAVELPGPEGAYSPHAAEPVEPRPAEPRGPRPGGTRDPRPDRLAARRARQSSMPLSLFERETLITDVLNELFGLGPLEALLADPEISDILVNRADQIFIEREGRLEADRPGVQGRPAPAADHRAHRQLGRPPHRRVEPDGGRAACRRLACQRRSSRRWRSTVPCSRSADSAPTGSGRRTSSSASR